MIIFTGFIVLTIAVLIENRKYEKKLFERHFRDWNGRNRRCVIRTLKIREEKDYPKGTF